MSEVLRKLCKLATFAWNLRGHNTHVIHNSRISLLEVLQGAAAEKLEGEGGQ
jgi:hypothetical protein